MPTTYKPVDADVRNLLDEVMDEDHPELAKVGVTVLVQFAYASDGAAALKHHGYPAYAIVSVVKLKDRVAKMEDCRIAVDELAWNENDQEWRKALLSHELEHVVVVKDKEGKVKKDAIGRPKLKLRVHDFRCEGFVRTIEKHGAKAIEAQSYKNLHKMMSQMKFPWG